MINLIGSTKKYIRAKEIRKLSLQEYKKLAIEKEIERKKQKKSPVNNKKQKRKERLSKKREKRKHKRIPTQYKVYIVSKHWTQRKNKYYQKHKRRCEICHSTKHIALHHMIYKNYGFESDDSLIPLCKEHHSDFHENYPVKANMKCQTLEYILEKREELGRDPLPKHLQKKFTKEFTKLTKQT